VKESGMSQYATEQEAFWAGEFGEEYINRHQGELLGARKPSSGGGSCATRRQFQALWSLAAISG